MALFIFTLILLVAMVASGIYVLKRAPYTTRYEAASTFDTTEAIAYVWSEIPTELRERIGRDGVKAILAFELDYLKQSGAVLNGRRTKKPAEPRVLGSPQSIDYILKRADGSGIEVTPEDVHTIIGAEIAYLGSIGAVGGEAGASS